MQVALHKTLYFLSGAFYSELKKHVHKIRFKKHCNLLKRVHQDDWILEATAHFIHKTPVS